MAKKLSLAEIKKRVSKRAKHLCEYCLLPESYSVSTFELEHISPRSKGGKKNLKNLAWSCSGCNKYKYNRVSIIDSESGDEIPLFNPRKDVWNEHFSWSEDFMEIIHLTPKGKVTVRALKLNREGLRNLRKLLHLVGEHPPK